MVYLETKKFKEAEELLGVIRNTYATYPQIEQLVQQMQYQLTIQRATAAIDTAKK